MFFMKNKITDQIKIIMDGGHDITKREIKGDGNYVCILFIKQLTDRTMLSNFLVKPLIRRFSEDKSPLDAFKCENEIIFTDDCHVETDENKILEMVLAGMTVVLFSKEEKFLVVNLKMVEKKAIEGPQLSYTLRGPKDCLSENLDVNLSLIRYRIKDPNLAIEMFEVGKRTKTRISVMYIRDIANSELIKKIEDRIKIIDTDGIIESGELQKYLLNNEWNLFPQMGIVERSDMACGALLEGKVMVLVEGSGLALVAPKVFTEFLWSCEDNYDNVLMSFLTKNLRIVAVIFSVILSSVFVIVTSFNYDILPSEFIIMMATSRAKVPFNAFTAALILEIVVEITREALLRVPKQIGPAVGIVAAIIIGQASIASGVFSPFLLIMVALGFMASFAVPDYTIMNPLRIFKFIFLILSGTLGLYGLLLGLFFMFTNIISMNTFGLPYLAPVAPFNWYDFTRTFFFTKTFANKRPNFLKTKDNVRTKTEPKPGTKPEAKPDKNAKPK